MEVLWGHFFCYRFLIFLQRCNEQKLFAFCLLHKNYLWERTLFHPKVTRRPARRLGTWWCWSQPLWSQVQMEPWSHWTLQSSGLCGKADGQLSRLCPICWWEPESCRHQPLCLQPARRSWDLSPWETLPFFCHSQTFRVHCHEKGEVADKFFIFGIRNIHNLFKGFILPLQKKRNKIHSRSSPEMCSNSLFSLFAAKAVQEKGILRKTVMSKAQGYTLFIMCKKPPHLVTSRTRLLGDEDETAASPTAL